MLKNHLKCKSQKGITLIALIITIIVMVVLVTVTLIITLGEDGVINKTKLAHDEQKKAEFKEFVEIAAKGNFDPMYDWGDDVKLSGKYNYAKIKREITQKYPNANFIFLPYSIPSGAAVNANTKNIEILEGQVFLAKELVAYFDNNVWPDKLTDTHRAKINAKVQELKETYVNDLREEYKAEGRENEFTLTVDDIGSGLGTSNRVSVLKAGQVILLSMIGYGSSMVVEYDGMAASVGFVNSNVYDYYIIMNKNEAEEIFDFTYTMQDEREVAEVKAYKGSSKDVKVPGLLIDDDGSSIPVMGIGDLAFVPRYIKMPVINLMTGNDPTNDDFEEYLYNNTSTLAQFKDRMGLNDFEFNCDCQENGQCTNKTCKNEFLKLIISSTPEEDMNDAGFVIGEDSVMDSLSTDNEGTLYVNAQLDFNEMCFIPIKPSKYKETNVKSIIVSEGIQSIGNSVFTMCDKLQTIYIPATLEDMGDDVFNGCISLAEMITMNENIYESSSKYGCPNDFVKTYIEPKLEAEF